MGFSVIKSTAITRSARNEPCTMNIAGHCNGNPETTVFAHFPLGDGGSNKLNGDLCGGYVCSADHDVLDGRVPHDVSGEDMEFYMRRSQLRTLHRLIEIGLVRVK